MALSFFLGKGGQSYNALEQRGRCFAKNRVAFPNKPQEIEQCCKTSPIRPAKSSLYTCCAYLKESLTSSF